MSASEIVKAWITQLEKDGKSSHTLAAYRRAVEHFIVWNKHSYDSDFDPAAIIPRDIEDWKAHQQIAGKASPASTNQRLVAMSSFFQWALSQGITRIDPTATVKSVGMKKREPKALSEKDLRRLLRAVHADGNPRDIAVIELLVGTGLRVGELLALKMGDLTINGRSGKVIVRMGKHDKYREVPLTPQVRQVLTTYLDTHTDSKNPDAPLWMGQRGALADRVAIWRILEKHTLAAQLPAIGPHVLRHTFATRYLKANPGDLRGLAALLGHSSLNTVMIYTEPTLDDLAGRMEKVDNGLIQ